MTSCGRAVRRRQPSSTGQSTVLRVPIASNTSDLMQGTATGMLHTHGSADQSRTTSLKGDKRELKGRGEAEEPEGGSGICKSR